MSTPQGPTSSPEIIASWEGPAILHPGVLFEEKWAEHLANPHAVADVAAWISVTGLSRVDGHPVRTAIRAKVLAFLREWRDRYGRGKVDEVKQELVNRLGKSRRNGQPPSPELLERVEALFREVDGPTAT